MRAEWDSQDFAGQTIENPWKNEGSQQRWHAFLVFGGMARNGWERLGTVSWNPSKSIGNEAKTTFSGRALGLAQRSCVLGTVRNGRERLGTVRNG